MLSFAANRPRSTKSHAAQPAQSLCIVDPQADAYHALRQSAEAQGVAMHVVATAEEALRLSRTHQIGLWVVNTNLPGLSGYELCGMLKSHSHRTAICLLADEYTIDAEQAAWRARATMFLCKGNHVAWLNDWLTSRTPRTASAATTPTA